MKWTPNTLKTLFDCDSLNSGGAATIQIYQNYNGVDSIRSSNTFYAILDCFKYLSFKLDSELKSKLYLTRFTIGSTADYALQLLYQVPNFL